LNRFRDRPVGHHSSAVPPIRAQTLLSLPVRLPGIALGRPIDLLLDPAELRVVGFDLLCGDEIHRFLPFPTAVISENEIAIRSPLVLLEEDELAFYRTRTSSLAALRSQDVMRGRRASGRLVDVVVAADGTVDAVVVDDDGREERIPVDETIRLRPASRSAA